MTGLITPTFANSYAIYSPAKVLIWPLVRLSHNIFSMIYSRSDPPAQNRSSKRGNKGQCNLRNMPPAGHPRSSSYQPIRLKENTVSITFTLGIKEAFRRQWNPKAVTFRPLKLLLCLVTRTIPQRASFANGPRDGLRATRLKFCITQTSVTPLRDSSSFGVVYQR
jgi:hypothetical protein